MKRKMLLLTVMFSSYTLFSQDMANFKLYNPADNAADSIAAAVKRAKANGKFVFVQVGGNWCIWCARFNDYITNDRQLDSTVRSDFVVYHMNYSKENYNATLLAKFGYPQRFGFPVFLVLDGEGRLLHTQNSGYLEDGKKSYEKNKVIEFFSNWRPKALDPGQYKEQ
ncbi:MAG: thioredoxin family protein [Chitinophagaceae bacterium]|jgi:thioredoxin-related protein|nr:thioredoxin family protein [Chitinophagaceae bacterium]OQY93816.1 MAG: thioredoxin family protein [Sphingobacteriales bacterium UTBCD1]